MALSLVGIGLYDENDISLRGLQLVQEADFIYLENYTSLMKCTPEDLEKKYGKKLIVADRELVEQSPEIIERAKTKNVVVLVMGDPLTATTHLALMMAAREHTIPLQVVHNASVISAVGATGLQPYKFGKMVTVPFPEHNYRPESYYQVIRQNQTLGLHTLLLLDLKPKEDKLMSAQEAITLLEEIEQKNQLGVLGENTSIIACARLGWPEQKIVYGKAQEIKAAALPGSPHCIIIPGQLHFTEEEALQAFALSK